MLGTWRLSVFKEFKKIKLKIFVILFVLIFLIETKVDIETSECVKLFEWNPESKALIQQTILSEVIKLTQLPGPREFSCQAPTLSLYKLSLLYLSEGGLLPK